MISPAGIEIRSQSSSIIRLFLELVDYTQLITSALGPAKALTDRWQIKKIIQEQAFSVLNL